MRPAFPCLIAATFPLLAPAAEVTDLPPRWRGDVHLAYDGRYEQVGLEEDERTWALRDHQAHVLGVAAEVAVWHGVALRLELPVQAAGRVSYPAARTMLFEPITGQGTFVDGDRIAEPFELAPSGVQGFWIGVAAAPFREDALRSLPVTSRLDLAVRTPGTTLYDAARGASPGGVAVRGTAAFSTERGPANPYARFGFQWEGPTEAAVTLPDGTAAGTVEVKGATTGEALLGAELVAWKNDRWSRFAIDLHVGVGYRGPETYPSGFWLPSVLDATRGQAVTRTESVTVRVGGGLDVHMTRYVGLRLGGDYHWFTPHRVEHPYDARTDLQSFATTWTVALVGRIRLKDDRL